MLMGGTAAVVLVRIRGGPQVRILGKAVLGTSGTTGVRAASGGILPPTI